MAGAKEGVVTRMRDGRRVCSEAGGGSGTAGSGVSGTVGSGADGSVRARGQELLEQVDAAASQHRSPVERAVCEGRDPGWEELLALADHVGPSPELAAVDDATLERRVRTGAARLAAETCRWLDLVAELVIRRVWAEQGCRTPAVWLAWAVGMGSSTARDHVRVALRLRELDRVREAFAAGSVSYSKVRAITRVAVPETEELLLRWSGEATGADMERIAAGFRRAQRGVLAGPGSAEAARDLRLRPRGDGTCDVVLRLPEEDARTTYAQLQRLVDLEDDEPEDEPENVLDDERSHVARHGAPVGASGEAPARSYGETPAGAPGDHHAASATASAEAPREVVPVETARRPRGARLADAMVHAVQDAVTADGTDTSGQDRHTLVLHMRGSEVEQPPGGVAPELPATARAADTLPVETSTGTVAAMSRRVLRRLACEAGIVLVATDDQGTPIDIGRRDRRLTTALRRALHDRDRSCRFPGCGARRHLHGHHIHHWGDGGPTDLANLVLLCSFHHAYVHDHDVDVRLRPHGAHEFRRRDGRHIPRFRPLPDIDGDGADQDHRPVDLVPADPAPDALEPVHWDGHYSLDTTVAVLQQQVHAVLPQAAGVLAA